MAATCLNMLPALGATIMVRFEDLRIDCVVTDVKNSYGKPRLKIRPRSGFGEQWVELGRVVNLPTAATSLEVR